MKVRLVYRNYKPLHELYRSFQIKSPNGIEFIIPAPKLYLRKFYPLYKNLGDLFITKLLLKWGQSLLFSSSSETKDGTDLLHFLQMIPNKAPKVPFIVDIEHAVSLGNFSKVKKNDRERILSVLNNKNCKKIIPLSLAAKKTLQILLNEKYQLIEDKVQVVYPALPNFYQLYKKEIDYSIVGKENQNLKLLFVGNDIYRKGLHEVLEAVRVLQRKNLNIALYIVSDATDEFIDKYNDLKSVYFLKPKFTKEEIIKKLFIPCDLFVLPTHGDTFGMVFLDALASGTPVITTDQFALPEIIRENYNGIFVKSQRLIHKNFKPITRNSEKAFLKLIASPEDDLIADLVKKIKYLYKNRDRLSEMGENALKDFANGGKFSIETRNKKLENIYKKAIE